jgi:uncharacterized ubiquitin-like protein YukD
MITTQCTIDLEHYNTFQIDANLLMKQPMNFVEQVISINK